MSIKLKNKFKGCLFLLSFFSSLGVHAETLHSVYESSLNYDAQYLQAKADYLSAKESKLSAWSSFFPQIGASGNLLNNYQNDSANNFSVNANQVIFNVAAMRQVAVANLQVKEAVTFLSSAQMSLMNRVAAGYFELVKANELLKVMQQQLKSIDEQLKAVKERYNVGHATITDLDRVKATYDLYRSEMLSEKIKLVTAKQKLSELCGYEVKSVPTLKFAFKAVKPTPMSINVWHKKASTQNFSLLAASQSVAVARELISVRRGGYFPSLSLTTSYYPEKLSNIDKHLIYGVDISFNAFRGGYTMAEVGKARAQYQKVLARRDQLYRTVLAETNSAYQGMLDGVSQVMAERTAVESNQSALRHTQQGYLSGTQTILDVLDQQNQLFSAERTYVEGRISYLNNIIKLERAAGTLSPIVLRGIQGWFTSSRVKR